MTTFTCPCGETVTIHHYSEDFASVVESRCKCGRRGDDYMGADDRLPRDQDALVQERHMASHPFEQDELSLTLTRAEWKVLETVLVYGSSELVKVGREEARSESSREHYDRQGRFGYEVARRVKFLAQSKRTAAA